MSLCGGPDHVVAAAEVTATEVLLATVVVAATDEVLGIVVVVTVVAGVVLSFVVVVVTAFVVVVDAFVVELVDRGQVPAAFSVLRVGVGVLGTLVFGATPTVIVALPPPV